MEQTVQSNTEEFLEALRALADRGELAGVILHANDTYTTDERRLNGQLVCPGFSRVGTFTSHVRELLQEYGLTDRLMFVHSGDFLSPSYVSNQLKSHGEHMVDLLSALGVTHVTLGNHEFDHDEEGSAAILLDMLDPTRASFEIVASNLEHTDLKSSRIRYWPPQWPFAAIIGLAGKVTVKDAVKHGFAANHWRTVLEPIVNEIIADGRASMLVVISHCDRNEDRDLKTAVLELWSNYGICLILGGHDHHMDWSEAHRGAVLVKNRSNLQSITTTLIPKWIVARPNGHFRRPVDKRATDAQMMQIGKKPFDAIFPPATEDDFEKCVSSVTGAIREQTATYRAPDAIDSFCGIVEEIASMSKTSILDDLQNRVGRQFLYDRALKYCQSDFTAGALADKEGRPIPFDRYLWRIWAPAFENWSRDPILDSIIRKWTPDWETKQIIWDGPPFKAAFVAIDTALRSGSTNFGNFVADCIAAHLRCDLAIINSGSFRSDMMIDIPLDMEDMRQTFVYDADDALVTTVMTVGETKALIAHGSAAVGKGAFPQVSLRATNLGDELDEALRVAIPRYLLADDHDGYQSLLAGVRNITTDELLSQVVIFPSHRIVDCFAAADLVEYDDAPRILLTRSTPRMVEWFVDFYRLAKNYDAANDSRRLARGGSEEQSLAVAWRDLKEALIKHIWRIHDDQNLMGDLIGHEGFLRIYYVIVDSEEQAKGPVDYRRLLEVFYSGDISVHPDHTE